MKQIVKILAKVVTNFALEVMNDRVEHSSGGTILRGIGGYIKGTYKR